MSTRIRVGVIDDHPPIVAALSDAIVAFAAERAKLSPDGERRMSIVMSTKELELRSMR